MAGSELSTNEAALRLGVSRPTVRKLLAQGAISGRTEQRGTRFIWRISEGSVASYLERHSASDAERRKRNRLTVSQLRDELDRLRNEVRNLAKSSISGEDVSGDLRAEVTALREALMQQRAIADALNAADQARAEMVQHLLAAVAAGETADQRRREA
jgi:excisionase family DNA binding protein